MKKINIKGTDEILYFEVSNKGLPIYMWQNNDKSNYYLSLGVKFGSLHTDYKIGNKEFHTPKGLAHYLEHLKFNEEGDKSANEFFESTGTQSNAFTTFEYTNYEVIGTEYFKDNLSHLLDFVYTPYFTSKLVNKERGIITEEIKMGLDNPYNNLYYSFFKNLFKSYNYRYEVAGTVDDIKNINVEDIKNAFDIFYNPENMFLIVSGNFNPYEVIETVNDRLDKREFKKFVPIQILDKNEPMSVVRKEEIIYGNVEVPKIKIGLKLKRNLFKEMDDISLMIYSSMIMHSNFGDTSQFHEYLFVNHIVDYISVSRDLYNDYLVLMVTFESRMPNEAIKIIKEKLNNLEIEESTLKRRCKANIASLVMTFDSVAAVNDHIQQDLIEYKKIVENIKEYYENVDIDQANKVLHKIKVSKDNLTVLKLLPFTD